MADEEGSAAASAASVTNETTNAAGGAVRRPCARAVLTYHSQVPELAEWVKSAVQEYAAKDDATFTIWELGIELVSVENDGAHLAAVQAWEERSTQQTPASDGALILSCMFDGMAPDGKEEYRRMHVWCKERNHALHVLNAKKRQHQVYTAKDELKAVGSNIVQTLIGKMEQVARRQLDNSKGGAQARRIGASGPASDEPRQSQGAQSAESAAPAAAAAPATPAPAEAAASAETETPAALAGVTPDTVPQPNPDNEWDCADNEAYFAKLVADLRTKLLEGQGECMVKVGIDASGTPSGLNEEEYAKALATIQRLAEAASAAASKVVEKTITKDAPRKCAELLIRQWGEEDYIDMRIAICGNVDSGKSTFVGVLTKGILDNGRGLVRQRVFRHRHEQETGRTSSISEQLIGFDSMGNVVNYSELKKEEELQHTKHQLSSKELSEKSAKMITFYDLAGHEKYLKTTVMGMTGSMPDYACIVISANNGIQRMTKEHLGLCLALKIPFYCVITSIDRCPDVVLKNTTASVVKILKQGGVHKLPYMVRNEDDVVICAKNIKDDRIAPIFHVSNVTGENLGLVRTFLNLLPVRRDWNSLAKLPTEVVIDSTFYVGGVGTVVGGIVSQGVLHPNDTILLGPNPNGHFRQAIIKSIHVKQVPVNKVEAGTAGCFALKKERRSDIRKGMVMLDARSRPQAVWEFEAEIVVLYHCTTIQSNYQPVVHIATVRQSCAITLIDCDLLRTGDKARCRFRFMYKPEYVKPGSKLIFREGRTKGLGTVTEIFP